MKKFLVLSAAIVLFVACDYATENVGLSPDVECVYINPMGWYVSGDTLDTAAVISEVHFVAETSIDCYLSKLVWEYYDAGGGRFYGPDEIALYMKIAGKTDPECCDTAIIYNIYLPLQPVVQHLSPGQSAKAALNFVFVDEYTGDKYDTAKVWYGFYMWPTLTPGDTDPFNWSHR